MSRIEPTEMRDESGGELALHILGFARTLRAAGFAVGPGQVLDALEAVRCAGVATRTDLHAALCAVLVRSPAERRIFDQAFHVHFRNPQLLERLRALMLPRLQPGVPQDAEPLVRRLAQALFPEGARELKETDVREERDALLTASDREVLQKKDFAEMSAQEQAQAATLLRESALFFADVATRRYRPAAQGPRLDLRATLREAHRHGGEVVTLVRERRRRRPPPLVFICDISGSMARYTRMFLIVAHTVSHARDRVSTFVFGTRLTNITPRLRHADVDAALGQVSTAVGDWAGGTRIGECLRQFNHAWSRRVLGQGAIVVLVTDGLEREPTPMLEREMARLRRSCRRLLWLNPLLRYEGFEALAAGVRTMLPHVHALCPAHNVESLRGFASALDDARAPAEVRRAGRSVGPSPPRHTSVKGS